MNKKAFVQACAIECLPGLVEGRFGAKGDEPAEKIIRASERLWDVLSDHGYGDATKKPVVPAEGYYASLNVPMKALFDRFWSAFHHGGLKKHDREGAAKAMMGIAGLPGDESLAKTIVAAAQMDAAYHIKNPEKSRKYAQGWLSGRRWEDYDVRESIQATERSGRAAMVSALESDIRALISMGADKPGSPLAGQLSSKRDELESVKHGE